VKNLENKFLNQNFSYFVGAIQGDGSRWDFFDKKMNYMRNGLSFNSIDFILVKKMSFIMNKAFKRKTNVYHKKDGSFGFTTSIKTLLKTFQSLEIDFKDPPKPPSWILKNIKFFGPYLAGVIDTDGSVCIKRKKYPQCKIKIISGHPQVELKSSIEKILNCKASIEDSGKIMKSTGKWYPGFDLVFLVSSKNNEIFRKYIVPHIQLERKKNIIELYLKKYMKTNN